MGGAVCLHRADGGGGTGAHRRTGPLEARFCDVAYLAVLLVLCKSLASLAYGLVLTPIVLFAPCRWQMHLAALFAIVAVAYPMLRNLQLIPLDAIIAQADAINPARAQSLGYRFNNEEQLLGACRRKAALWLGRLGA